MPRASAGVLIKVTQGGRTSSVGQILTQESFVETKDLDFGSDEVEKFLEALNVYVDSGQPGLRFQIGYKNRLADAVTWLPVETLTQGDQMNFIRPPVARYYRFRITDTSVSDIWKLSGFSVYGRVEGSRL